MDWRENTAVVILGMHRSGTSWLTGALQQAGLHLGRHHTWNPYNQKGNRENPDLFELHEEILARSGFAWDSPPPLDGESLWTQGFLSRAERLCAEIGQRSPWGFKDPRTLLLLDGWLQLLSNVRLVGIFRHPLAVAASLESRNLMARDRALELWLEYNLRLIDAHERFGPFPLLSFDWERDRLHEALFQSCRTLGLDDSPHRQDFYAEDLKHNRVVSGHLPAEVEAAYIRLKAWSEGSL